MEFLSKTAKTISQKIQITSHAHPYKGVPIAPIQKVKNLEIKATAGQPLATPFGQCLNTVSSKVLQR
jgi:hypothetical protein